MARPKKIQSETIGGNAPEIDNVARAADGEITQNGGSVSPSVSRASFTLTPGGTVAWDRIHGKSKEQLRVMVSDPEFASQVGIVTPTGVSVTAAGPMFDDATLGLFLGALGRVKTQAAIASGYPVHIARIQGYTPEEAARVGADIAAVLNHYAGPYLGKHPLLVKLAADWATVEISKLMLMRQQWAIEQERGQAPPAPESPSNVLGVQ